MIFAIIGTLWLSQIVTAQAHFFPQMPILLAIMGMGGGMVFQPLTVMGLSDVGPNDTGAASGLINVAHQSGSSFGLAVIITVFNAALLTAPHTKLQFAQAISHSILGSAAFVVAALAVVLLSFLPVRSSQA